MLRRRPAPEQAARLWRPQVLRLRLARARPSVGVTWCLRRLLRGLGTRGTRPHAKDACQPPKHADAVGDVQHREDGGDARQEVQRFPSAHDGAVAESEWNHAAQTDRLAMLPDEIDLSPPVSVVLGEEPSRRIPGGIEDLDSGVENHAAAGLTEPEVEVLVFVAWKGLVEESDTLEDLASESAAVNRVDLDTSARCGTARPTNPAERVICNAGNRPFDPALPHRDRQAADIPGAGLFGRGDASLEIVVRVTSPALHADDKIAAGSADTGVESVGDEPVPVLDERQRQAIARRGRSESLDGMVT